MQIHVKSNAAAGRSSPILVTTHSEEAKCWHKDDVLTEFKAGIDVELVKTMLGSLRPKKRHLAMGQFGLCLVCTINVNGCEDSATHFCDRMCVFVRSKILTTGR